MSYYRLNNPPVISETVDGEVIVINLDDGCYHSMRENSAAVWDNLNGGHSVDEVLEACEGDKEAARAALEKFVSDLQSKQLVVQMDAPPPNKGALKGWASEGLMVETFDDMTDLLGLDPVHEVDLEAGWPVKPEAAAGE